MFRELSSKVTDEIRFVLDAVDENKVGELVRSIIDARQIVVSGAGRVGFSCKGFAMRLGHLGKIAFASGDSTFPHVAGGDLLILCSSSGETQTVYDVALLGKKSGAHLFVITASPDSRMGKLADSVLVLKAPTKFGPTAESGNSIQPMATLFEQCSQIVFDIVVLMLMKETQQSKDDLWARHSNLD